MKIINRTRYDGRFLRTVVCAVHRHLIKHEGKLHSWRYLKVYVEYTRGRGSRGYAYLCGSPMTLRLEPRGERSDHGDKWHSPGALTRSLVYITYHELMHCYGYRHNEFNNIPRHEITALIPKDWPEYVPEKTVTPTAKPDLQLVRYGRIVAREKQWTTKLKRAQTALKKLRQQRRDYERRLTAAGKMRSG